jgi:hypothetical protein
MRSLRFHRQPFSSHPLAREKLHILSRNPLICACPNEFRPAEASEIMHLVKFFEQST